MSAKSLAKIALVALLLPTLCGSGCPRPPPTITQFEVAPSSACANGRVDVMWAVDADSVSLTSSPLTDTPAGPLPGPTGGFGFTAAATDTTFTLTAVRGGQTVTAFQVVRILLNPVAIDLALPYDCANHRWSRAGHTNREYPAALTVDSITNLGPQPEPISVEHGSRIWRLALGETARLTPPVRFIDIPWIVHLADGPQPVCTRIENPLNGEITEQRPPDVRIRVTSTCR